MTTQHTRWSQFGVLITVFFFWGFVAASNDILIPVFKHAFNLSQAQSQLVSVAFYVAYTIGSLIYHGADRTLVPRGGSSWYFSNNCVVRTALPCVVPRWPPVEHPLQRSKNRHASGCPRGR